MTSPASPGRRRRAKAATSEDLVAAAARVIAREGIPATTTRKIADEAGVPLGTVHYWFADKAALLEEVVRDVTGRLEKAVAASRHDNGDDIRDGLHAAWAEITGDDPGTQLGMYELTALAVRTPSMRELARAQYRGYRETAARAMAPALDGVDGERAAALAELVAVTFDGLCLAWLADPEGSRPARVLDLLADMLIAQTSNLAGSPAPTRKISGSPSDRSTTVVGSTPQSPESSTASTE
jgi:AcrR family transcriptional regulator